MQLKPDEARQVFRDGLEKRALRKKAIAIAKPKPDQPLDVQKTLAEHTVLLREILDLLNSPGAAPEFVVTERDQNGKVKSFTVSEGMNGI